MTTTTTAVELAKKIGREHRAAFREEFGNYPVRGQVGDWDVNGTEAMEGEVRAEFEEFDWDGTREAYLVALFDEAHEPNEDPATTTLNLDDIKDAIRSEYLDAVRDGNHWHYVRAWPSGTISRGAEPSETVPESEYYRKGNPYPVTIWSIQGISAGPAEMVFEWEECAPEAAEFWADRFGQIGADQDKEHAKPYRLTDAMIEDLDWETIMPEVVARLEEAGYTIED